MDVILTRDKALTVPLLSTYGTAILLGRDGGEVTVPLAPLLGASILVKSMVNESQLHPGIHGPLILSFAVASDILASVAELLGAGQSFLKEENIEDVKQVMDMLGVEANLSYRRTSNNYYEHVPVNAEEVKLEIAFEPMSEEESNQSVGDDEFQENLFKECFEDTEYKGKCPDESYRTNQQLAKTTVNKCKVCGYFAPRASHLVIHMRRHTGEKPYKCTICNYSCSQQGDLKRHIRIHTGEKPYKCTVCNFSSSHPGHFRKHCRIHNKEKPYKCTICGYATVDRGNLKVHKMKHTGAKPHKCNICGYATNYALSLRLHKMKHTGEKPHKCNICDFSSVRSNSLKVHMRKHTGEIFKCQMCDYTAKTIYKVREHEKKEHDA